MRAAAPHLELERASSVRSARSGAPSSQHSGRPVTADSDAVAVADAQRVAHPSGTEYTVSLLQGGACPLEAAEDALARLVVLDYQRRFCQPRCGAATLWQRVRQDSCGRHRGLLPFSRDHFAFPSAPATASPPGSRARRGVVYGPPIPREQQFEQFFALATWLMGLAGGAGAGGGDDARGGMSAQQRAVQLGAPRARAAAARRAADSSSLAPTVVKLQAAGMPQGLAVQVAPHQLAQGGGRHVVAVLAWLTQHVLALAAWSPQPLRRREEEAGEAEDVEEEEDGTLEDAAGGWRVAPPPSLSRLDGAQPLDNFVGTGEAEAEVQEHSGVDSV